MRIKHSLKWNRPGLFGPRLQTVSFLHIGKNAGTEIGRWIELMNAESSEYIFEKKNHNFRLSQLSNKDLYFFSIREPISRFVSGFYSRKRKGQPRLHLEWSRHERKAFSEFPHAVQLAESIYLPDSRGDSARSAMMSIFHVNTLQSDWFQGRGYFLETNPPVWIIRQWNLANDMAHLSELLDLKSAVAPEPGNESSSHRFNYDSTPPLSDKAVQNLRRWYEQDFYFVDSCNSWLQQEAP